MLRIISCWHTIHPNKSTPLRANVEAIVEHTLPDFCVGDGLDLVVFPLSPPMYGPRLFLADTTSSVITLASCIKFRIIAVLKSLAECVHNNWDALNLSFLRIPFLLKNRFLLTPGDVVTFASTYCTHAIFSPSVTGNAFRSVNSKWIVDFCVHCHPMAVRDIY